MAAPGPTLWLQPEPPQTITHQHLSTLPPAKVTGTSHHLDFLLFLNCIPCFRPCLQSQWALEGLLGRQGGSGRVGRLYPMPCHSYHCLGATSSRKCEPCICPNAFPGSAIPSNTGFVVPGSHPCVQGDWSSASISIWKWHPLNSSWCQQKVFHKKHACHPWPAASVTQELLHHQLGPSRC